MNASRLARHSMPLRACACVLACACALALAGCSTAAQRDAEAISQGLTQDLQGLREVSSSAGGDLLDATFAAQLSQAGVDVSAVYGPLFSGLTFSVDGVDVATDGTTATAHLTVTNKDLAQAFANYQSTLADELSASDARERFGSMREDGAAFTAYLMDLLADAASDASLPEVTTNVDVSYTLTDGVWTADDTSGLRKAVLGGLDASELASAAAQAADAVASGAMDAASAAGQEAVTLPAPEEDARPVADAEGADAAAGAQAAD